MPTKPTIEHDPEFVAMSAVHAALKGLDSDTQARVLNYVAVKLKLGSPITRSTSNTFDDGADHTEEPLSTEARALEPKTESANVDNEELEGISPIAKKWMVRNGLQAKQLSSIFSLGVDEIDLVARSVPGKRKAEKLHSILLLKGLAAYLGSGVARFTHEQLKEACLDYDAYDPSNFAAVLKRLSSEVSGDKEKGYVLTARGLTRATEMVKKMTQPGKAA